MEDEKKNSLLVSDQEPVSYEELVETVNNFRDQLQSLDYRVTNKNFGSKIYQAKETIASKGRFVAGAEDEVVIMDGQHHTYRLWAGAKDPADAPFSVDKFGNIIATSLDLSDFLQIGEAADDINSGVDTISGTKITDSTITTGKLVAGEIVGFTVTGGTVRTASGSTRVELNGANNDIRILASGVVRALGFSQGWTYYNSSGSEVGTYYAGTSALSGTRTLLIDATASSTGSIQLAAGSSGYVTMAVGGDNYLYASGGLGGIVIAKHVIPLSGLKLGDLGTEWASVWADTGVFGDIIAQEGITIYSGYDLVLNNGNIDCNGTVTADDFSGGSLTLTGDISCDDISADNIDCGIVQLSGGGYIDNARAMYYETGRSTNPSISGEVRYYDSGTKGFRGYVNGFRGQFDMTAV